MRFEHYIVVHFHELFKGDIGCKILIDLLDLLEITSLINNEVSGIQPDCPGQPHPSLYEVSNSEGDMPMLNCHMIHQISPSHSVHICTLTIIHNS